MPKKDIIIFRDLKSLEQMQTLSKEFEYSQSLILADITDLDKIKLIKSIDSKQILIRINYELFNKKTFAKQIKTRISDDKFKIIVDFSDISKDREFINKTRDVFSSKQISGITGLENWGKKDSLNYKSSGISKAICHLAVKNDIAIIFSVKSIMEKSGTERSRLLGRIKQNIHFCTKYKVKMCLSSFAENISELSSAEDIQALAEILGMNTKEARESVECNISEKGS